MYTLHGFFGWTAGPALNKHKCLSDWLLKLHHWSASWLFFPLGAALKIHYHQGFLLRRQRGVYGKCCQITVFIARFTDFSDPFSGFAPRDKSSYFLDLSYLPSSKGFLRSGSPSTGTLDADRMAADIDVNGLLTVSQFTKYNWNHSRAELLSLTYVSADFARWCHSYKIRILAVWKFLGSDCWLKSCSLGLHSVSISLCCVTTGTGKHVWEQLY